MGPAGMGTGGTGPAGTGPVRGVGGPGGFFQGIGEPLNRLGLFSIIAGVFAICCAPAIGTIGSGGAFLFDFLPAAAAVVLGFLHLQKMKRGQATNRNLAIIGIALGAAAILSSICFSGTGVGHSLHNNVNFY
jgi:hypothetical protein